MVNVAEVHIWSEYAGAVLWNESTQTASFEFNPEFSKLGLDLAPLTMPVNKPRIFSFGTLSKDTYLGLPGLLADALPDAYGKALLDRWLATIGRAFANPVERLCYQGNRSMGALEFRPAQDNYLENGSAIEISSLVDIAKQVLHSREKLQVNLNDNSYEALVNIIRVGTSAGGARAKAVIAYNETTGDVRSGQIDAPKGYMHWLLKLDGVTNKSLGDPTHYGLIEYIYYLMAKSAGIEISESRLLEENGRAHFMTQRFDRINGNEKLHTQTLCGLAHFDYKLLRAYSYEQLFQVMRQLQLPYSQAEQMYRRMVFNVIARNQDDHTKNTSFVMNRSGEWSLSPAYDVSWAYNPKGEWTSQHQMSICNKWSDITQEDLTDFAKKINIKRPIEIIEQVADAVSRWHLLATKYRIPKALSQSIESTLLYKDIGK
jgi:serine/threonine-protein kinase HipA